MINVQIEVYCSKCIDKDDPDDAIDYEMEGSREYSYNKETQTKSRRYICKRCKQEISVSIHISNRVTMAQLTSRSIVKSKG